MASQLESPADDEALYLARGDEVIEHRPVLTGDVFQNAVIAGLDRAPGLAMIVTHPCSMRRDGVHLRDQLQMVPVQEHAAPPDDWNARSLTRKVMPLPKLLGEGGASHAAKLEDIGLTRSAELSPPDRIACLSVIGVNLLQQRLVHSLTRAIIPTFQFHAACAHVFIEVELQEEWVESAVEAGFEAEKAAAEFHEFIRGQEPGRSASRQDLLQERQAVAVVRRACRVAAQERYQFSGS